MSAAVGIELERAIARNVSRLGDWMLMGVMGSGVAAAVVIVTMLMVGLSQNAPSSAGFAPMAQSPPQRAGDSLGMFARADAGPSGVVIP
jgi:hypothetical protein